MVNVAMIGTGNISGIYIKNITEVFREVRLIGLCDLVPEKAADAAALVEKQRAQGCDCPAPRIYSDMYEAFNDPDVQVILNLTRPYQHYEVTKQALLHGKHVYSEKPLAADMDEGDELVGLAIEKGLLLGGAPDTFMGAGLQTCRALIDGGAIGEVVGASAHMIGHGPESWHPDPEFFFKRGGGPMMDMGPYYVTALINLLGEVRGVSGAARRTRDKRIITSEPLFGSEISVDVNTYITGTLHFSSGAIGTLFTTWDVWYGCGAGLEVYGTEGTLFCPDPNTFGGPVRLLRPEDNTARRQDELRFVPWNGAKEVPLMFDYSVNSRALGLSDMCKALETGRDFRPNYRQQHHVLEILTGIARSAARNEYIPLRTKYERPEPMRHNPMHGVLD